MSWPTSLVEWEWAIGEFAVLGLLFFELYRLRRSQRRDREATDRQSAETPSAAGNAEGQHRLDP